MCKQCSVEINYFLLDIKNSKRSKTILSLKEKYKFFIKNVLQPVDPLNQGWATSLVGGPYLLKQILRRPD